MEAKIIIPHPEGVPLHTAPALEMCRKEGASFFLSLFNLVSCSLWLLSLVMYCRATDHPKCRGFTLQSFVLLTHMPSLLHAAPARATQRLGTIWRLGPGTIWKLSHSDTLRLNLAVGWHHSKPNALTPTWALTMWLLGFLTECWLRSKSQYLWERK